MKTVGKLSTQTLTVTVLLVTLGGLIQFVVLPQLADRHPEVRTLRDAPHVKIVQQARTLQVGDLALDFRVVGEAGAVVSLSDFRDKWVVLVFSRGHW